MPSACKRRAAAAPMRRAAPVTSAVLPSSFPVFCMSGSRMGVGLIKPETDMRISQPLAELPKPSADALAHSARLKELIRAEIAAAGGRLGVERFMELALDALGGGDILELGAPSGRTAAELLNDLARLGALPQNYLILEVSAELRERQQHTLAELAPELRE